MNCHYCGDRLYVLKTNFQDEQTIRIFQCRNCDRVFWSSEKLHFPNLLKQKFPSIKKTAASPSKCFVCGNKYQVVKTVSFPSSTFRQIYCNSCCFYAQTEETLLFSVDPYKKQEKK